MCSCNKAVPSLYIVVFHKLVMKIETRPPVSLVHSQTLSLRALYNLINYSRHPPPSYRFLMRVIFIDIYRIRKKMISGLSWRSVGDLQDLRNTVWESLLLDLVKCVIESTPSRPVLWETAEPLNRFDTHVHVVGVFRIDRLEFNMVVLMCVNSRTKSQKR